AERMVGRGGRLRSVGDSIPARRQPRASPEGGRVGHSVRPGPLRLDEATVRDHRARREAPGAVHAERRPFGARPAEARGVGWPDGPAPPLTRPASIGCQPDVPAASQTCLPQGLATVLRASVRTTVAGIAVPPICVGYVATVLMWPPSPSCGKSRRIGLTMAT